MPHKVSRSKEGPRDRRRTVPRNCHKSHSAGAWRTRLSRLLLQFPLPLSRLLSSLLSFPHPVYLTTLEIHREWAGEGADRSNGPGGGGGCTGPEELVGPESVHGDTLANSFLSLWLNGSQQAVGGGLTWTSPGVMHSPSLMGPGARLQPCEGTGAAPSWEGKTGRSRDVASSPSSRPPGGDTGHITVLRALVPQTPEFSDDDCELLGL